MKLGVLVASTVVSQTQRHPSAGSLCRVCGARLSYFLLLSPCAVISEPDPALPSGWVSVLFVESQTQLLSSAESLRCVECERDSVLLLSPEVVHKSRVGSANPY